MNTEDPVGAAIATCRVETRLPRPRPWPWAILADDEEFLREFDHPRTRFWLVRVQDGSFRLVAEEDDPRSWWVCDLPGALSERDASSIAEGVILAHDLGRLGRWGSPDGGSQTDDAGMGGCPHHGEPDGMEAGLAKGGTWEVASPQVLPDAHRRSDLIHLDAGTLLRCEHSWPVPNAWEHPWSILFRFHVLSGSHLGACVLLETDMSANLSRHGLAVVPDAQALVGTEGCQ
jgi:hypothetical protein